MLNLVDKLVPLLGPVDGGKGGAAAPQQQQQQQAPPSPDLVHAVVRLLLNLSFDADLRAKMVQAGALPKLVELLKDERNQVRISNCFLAAVIAYECSSHWLGQPARRLRHH